MNNYFIWCDFSKSFAKNFKKNLKFFEVFFSKTYIKLKFSSDFFILIKQQKEWPIKCWIFNTSYILAKKHYFNYYKRLESNLFKEDSSKLKKLKFIIWLIKHIFDGLA